MYRNVVMLQNDRVIEPILVVFDSIRGSNRDDPNTYTVSSSPNDLVLHSMLPMTLLKYVHFSKLVTTRYKKPFLFGVNTSFRTQLFSFPSVVPFRRSEMAWRVTFNNSAIIYCIVFVQYCLYLVFFKLLWLIFMFFVNNFEIAAWRSEQDCCKRNKNLMSFHTANAVWVHVTTCLQRKKLYFTNSQTTKWIWRFVEGCITDKTTLRVCHILQ